MDVAYIYTWRRKEPLRLNYTVYEVIVKRIKLQTPVSSRLTESNTKFASNKNSDTKSSIVDKPSSKDVDMKESVKMDIDEDKDSVVNSDKPEPMDVDSKPGPSNISSTVADSCSSSNSSAFPKPKDVVFTPSKFGITNEIDTKKNTMVSISSTNSSSETNMISSQAFLTNVSTNSTCTTPQKQTVLPPKLLKFDAATMESAGLSVTVPQAGLKLATEANNKSNDSSIKPCNVPMQNVNKSQTVAQKEQAGQTLPYSTASSVRKSVTSESSVVTSSKVSVATSASYNCTKQSLGKELAKTDSSSLQDGRTASALSGNNAVSSSTDKLGGKSSGVRSAAPINVPKVNILEPRNV